MRKWVFLSGILLVLSCNNNDKVAEDMPVENPDNFPAGNPIWISDYDTVKHQFFLKKQRTVDTDSLTAENLVSNINAAWGNVKLVFKKVSNDTLYVSIPDSDFLTERMGSSGAEAYIASTTYNLTELRGIKFVNYDLAEGEHLSPGVYSREDFEHYQ